MDSIPVALRFVPQGRNAAFSVAALLFQVATMVLTPLIWQWSGWAFAAYTLLYGYVTLLTWLMIHESIHFKLLNNRAANILVGRLHGITFGCPFHILKIGHMTHNRYNRGALDSSELIPSDARRLIWWRVSYYGRLFGMLYVSEVLSPLAFFFWKRVKCLVAAHSKNRALVALLELFTRRMVQSIQLDAILCVAFFAAQIWFNRYGLWPFFILFFWRGFIVSFYDNAYHYGTDPYDHRAAKNLSMPAFLQVIMLNHNLHRVHHRYPTSSWAVLRDFERRDAEQYDASLSSTIWQQLKGPVRRPARTTGPRAGAGQDEAMVLLEND